MGEPQAEIGVFGGSGFYSFLDSVEEVEIETPYGTLSGPVVIGEIEGRKVAFLPRHGSSHQFPPHKINYRVNIYAMKELGVKQIISPFACGSLQPDIKPGDFVIVDQFVDRTNNRKDTFYDGPISTHVSSADPYCGVIRKIAFDTAKEMNISVTEKGTVVVINGPRFGTRAESKWFSKMGWEVVNMTQYPEVILARELEICFAGIALITDYDVGFEGHPEVEPVSLETAVSIFNENNEKVKDLLINMIPKLPKERKCICASALEGARF